MTGDSNESTPGQGPSKEGKTEEAFFRSRPRDDSFVRPESKPPSLAKRLITGGVLVAVIGAGLIWHFRSSASSTIWVVNPGPEIVKAAAAGRHEVVEPGKLVELRIPYAASIPVTVTHDGGEETIEVRGADDTREVTIVDLDGDGAYVIADVSFHYNAAAGKPGALKILHESRPPARIHRLPYATNKLVRPGRALPEKDSWELNVFRRPSSDVEMFKVFRVDPKRLEDREKLTAVLTEATSSKNAPDYENMMANVRTATQANSLIPRSKN